MRVSPVEECVKAVRIQTIDQRGWTKLSLLSDRQIFVALMKPRSVPCVTQFEPNTFCRLLLM